MVEGTGLENRHTGEPGIESSNLSLSVLKLVQASPAASRNERRFAFSLCKSVQISLDPSKAIQLCWGIRRGYRGQNER